MGDFGHISPNSFDKDLPGITLFYKIINQTFAWSALSGGQFSLLADWRVECGLKLLDPVKLKKVLTQF